MRTSIAVAALVGTSLLLSPASASAANESIIAVREAAERYVASHLSPSSRVTAAPMDNRLRLVACEAPLQAESTGTPGNAGSWTIAVSCSAPQAWRLYVPVRVSDMKSVLVLTRNLMAGQPIPADALRTETRDAATLGFGFISDASLIVGKQLRRPLGVGSVLTPDAVVAQAIIRRGQQVQLIGRAGGFEVRAEGKALGDGAPGENVTVENVASRRVVQGVVLDDGSVEVRL